MFDYKRLFLVFCVSTVASIGAMNKEAWINKRAQEITAETEARENRFLKKKSDEVHEERMCCKSVTTTITGLLFSGSVITYAPGLIMTTGTLFALSLAWLIHEYRNPSKASIGRTPSAYHRETRGADWAKIFAANEWERNHTKKRNH